MSWATGWDMEKGIMTGFCQNAEKMYSKLAFRSFRPSIQLKMSISSIKSSTFVLHPNVYMHFKNNTKQRFKTIQGLRSFKDTLPKNIKKIIKKKGHIFSETLNNWKYIVGDDLFQICYPKSFKNSNKFGVSTLQIMVKRGHEIDLEYSKKVIMDKMNSFFGYAVVEKLKFISFDDAQTKFKKLDTNENHVTNIKYADRINSIKNDKIKKSLLELTKLFKQR